MSTEKKVISPISCQKEPMSTVHDHIAEFARVKDIPFSLAVRKFLIVGNSVMESTSKFRKVKNDKP